MRARLGGLATSARGHTNTAAAHEGFARKFLDEVDPDRTLPPSERARRADAARRLHMGRLALKSSIKRKRKTPVIEPSGAFRGGRQRHADDPAAA